MAKSASIWRISSFFSGPEAIAASFFAYGDDLRIFPGQQSHRLFGDSVEIIGDEAGMHVQLVFRQDRYASLDWRGLEEFGVRFSTFDDYSVCNGMYPGRVVLGYGNLTEEEISEGLGRIYRYTEAKKIVPSETS